MKNRYDYLKEKYGAWVKLKNKTGHFYNPLTNTFTMSEEEWRIEIEGNKYVEPLRNAGLLFPELCIQLFDGVASHGVVSFGPSSTMPDIPNSLDQAPLSEDVDVEVIPNTQETHAPSSTQETDAPSSTQQCSSRPQTQNKKRKSRQTSNPNVSEIEEKFSKVIDMMATKYGSNDMDACLQKLEELGYGTNHPLYDIAVFAFRADADCRQMWLRLKPESCDAFIRAWGRKQGLL